MKLRFRSIAAFLVAASLTVFAARSNAFALLGPIQPWMQTTNGVIVPGDIGGPMSIGSGYRWNVPVLTYGFDQSFLDYFGSNGVAAVEQAIQLLNDLPPASQMAPTNYPFESDYYNLEAESQYLFNLRSATLSLLLEHLGLASPTRYVYVVNQGSPLLTNGPLSTVLEGSTLTNYVFTRNYDPLTLNATPYVNNVLYDDSVFLYRNQFYLSLLPDPPEPPFNAVADVAQPSALCKTFLNNWIIDQLNAGSLHLGLTYDDIGGLKYLLSPTNVNYEMLIPGVVGTSGNSSSVINGAWRPGVDKITFIRHPTDPISGAFLPTNSCYTDHFLSGGELKCQTLKRTIVQPDFLFSAGDVAAGDANPYSYYSRTGTSNWMNNAASNGNSSGEGPGVIQPPVQIVFNKLGQEFATWGDPLAGVGEDELPAFWGSFDSSTNPPIVYPVPFSGTNQFSLRMWLEFGTNGAVSVWTPSSSWGVPYAMQTSTNLETWLTIFTVTNNGSVYTYHCQDPTPSIRFFQLVPCTNIAF